MDSHQFEEVLKNLKGAPIKYKVLEWILEGYTNSQIAMLKKKHNLGGNEGTVRKQVSEIYRDFNLQGDFEGDRSPRRKDLLALFEKYSPNLIRSKKVDFPKKRLRDSLGVKLQDEVLSSYLPNENSFSCLEDYGREIFYFLIKQLQIPKSNYSFSRADKKVILAVKKLNELLSKNNFTQDKKVLSFLNFLKSKSTLVKTCYEQISVQAFYFCIIFGNQPNHPCLIGDEFSIFFDQCNPSLNPYVSELNLDYVLVNCFHDLVELLLVEDSYINVLPYLTQIWGADAYAKANLIEDRFQMILEHLSNEIIAPEDDDDEAWWQQANYWWKSRSLSWKEDLQELISQRKIIYNWQFDESQRSLLRYYYHASHAVVEKSIIGSRWEELQSLYLENMLDESDKF